MRFNKTTAKVGMAAIMSMGLITSIALLGGTASAKKAPAATITCTSLSATVTFSPALQPGSATTAKSYTTTISGATTSGCTESPAGTVTAASTTSSSPVKTKLGNSCANLADPPSGGKPSVYKFTTTWNGTGGTSNGQFKGTTTTSSGFLLSGGKVTGAYATKNGASIQANLSSASVTAIAVCAGGSGSPISTITISSGKVVF